MCCGIPDAVNGRRIAAAGHCLKITMRTSEQYPITPFGHCSLLHLATVYANICHVWRPEDLAECFEMVTRRAAKNLRRDDYGIEVGNPADLVVLDCADRVEAVCQPAAPLYGFKRGHMVFEREPVSLQGPS